MPRPRPLLVRLICLTAAVSGVGTLAAAVATEPWATDASPWLLVAFALAVTATRLVPLHLTHHGTSEGLHLDEVFFVPMVLMLSPLQVLGALLVALLVGSAVTRRGWLKLAFNVGTVTTTAGAGVLAAHLLGDGAGGLRDVVAALAGGLLNCAAAALAVAAVISAATGTSVRALVLDGLRLRLGVWVGSLGLGAVVAALVTAHPLGFAAALAPVALLHVGYAGVVRQRRERMQADALYDVANRLHATVDSATVRSTLLEAARELLSAGEARVVVPSEPERPGALRVALGEDAALEVGDRATGGAWTAGDASRLQALAAVASGALANALLYDQRDAISRSLGEGVIAIGPDGLVTFINPAASELLGWSPEDLVGRELARCTDPEGFVAGRWVHLPRLLAGETLRLDEYALVARDGSPLDVALTASPVIADGVVTGAVVVLRDVRERKALERRLVHQAFHDSLTGLPNRSLFLDRLEHARARSLRDGTTQAVLFVDVDRFKVVNDSLGHRVGDQVLQAVAARIVSEVRPSDTVARFGGDEFTVLLESIHDADEPARAAERIVRALQQPISAGGRDVVVTVSIGIAVGVPGRTTGDLVAAADIAMYQAKNQGKNRCVLAAEDADEQALARLDLETELRRAIAERELEVHYQPVVHAASGELYGLEALVRWRHPTWGLVPPARFMDVAEESGLVVPLGAWVLQEACVAGVEWNRAHPDQPVVMAVNLSARQFQQPDLCDQVSRVLAGTGLPPHLLALEITETAVMDDTTATMATLQALKALQVRLSIDDFGTGYSSLSYLKRFPVDAIKIDKSFVDGLGTSDVDGEIVRAVVRLASAVGMQTVAEGVETEEQRQALRALGCTMLQGFLVSRPMVLPEVDARFRRTLPSQRRPSARGVVHLP